MSTKLTWKGDEVSRKMQQGVVQHLNSAAESMVSVARQLSPVRTGFMRNQIKQTKQASTDSLQSEVEAQAFYSLYVEYGTVNMDAQPFFTPAFGSAKRQLASVKGVF